MANYTHAEVNTKGCENLIEYLRDWLKDPEAAEGHADYLINNIDGSDPDERTICVEVRGMHTQSGNPMTYSFDRDELTYVTIDEDGNEIMKGTKHGREVSEHCTNMPLACNGFTSYRYQGRFGWIMIGARNHPEALQEANRSLEKGGAVLGSLQIWSDASQCYVAATSENEPESV